MGTRARELSQKWRDELLDVEIGGSGSDSKVSTRALAMIFEAEIAQLEVLEDLLRAAPRPAGYLSNDPHRGGG